MFCEMEPSKVIREGFGHKAGGGEVGAQWEVLAPGGFYLKKSLETNWPLWERGGKLFFHIHSWARLIISWKLLLCLVGTHCSAGSWGISQEQRTNHVRNCCLFFLKELLFPRDR